MDRPIATIKRTKEIQEKYNITPEEATSYYYKLSQDSD